MRRDDLVADNKCTYVRVPVWDEFLHVDDAVVEGYGFENGVGDVYVVTCVLRLVLVNQRWV